MEISVSAVFGVLKYLISPISSRLERMLFYRAYEISTLHKSHRQQLGRHPYLLDNCIEYDLHWEPYYLARKQYMPQIWVRALPGESYSRITIAVTAENSKIRYQSTVTLFKISDKPTQVALPGIPLRNLKFNGGFVYTQYDKVTTEIKELISENSNSIRKLAYAPHTVTPLDNLDVALGLKKGDVAKWGEVFNLEFIEMQICEERIRLIAPSIMRQEIYHRLRRKFFNLNLVVKVIFWRNNIFTAKQLSSCFANYLREHG